MTLYLSLIEHLQVQNASPPIGCLKELLNCHWLLLKTCAEIENLLCPTYLGVQERNMLHLDVVTLRTQERVCNQ
jgi:hypothetical protein